MNTGLYTGRNWDASFMQGASVNFSSSGGIVLPGSVRLDQSESVWFARQLEFIDSQEYMTLEPTNLSRTYIPTQPNVPDWAVTYTFRMFEQFAEAKVIGNAATDLPRADVDGAEKSRVIKLLGAAYGWDFREIKASAATGVSLDVMKASAARFSVDQLIDVILALGLPKHNLEGLLTLTGPNIVTPTTKSGGGTLWANGTSDEIAADLFKMATAIANALNQAGAPTFTDLTCLIPVEQYSLIAQKRMGDGSDTTVLQFVIQNSPFINAIEPWRHCKTAGVGSTARAVMYPRNPLVVAGLVPMEVQSMAPMQRNLEFIVNVVASCGGVVVRYPVAMAYMDGF